MRCTYAPCDLRRPGSKPTSGALLMPSRRDHSSPDISKCSASTLLQLIHRLVERQDGIGFHRAEIIIWNIWQIRRRWRQSVSLGMTGIGIWADFRRGRLWHWSARFRSIGLPETSFDGSSKVWVVFFDSRSRRSSTVINNRRLRIAPTRGL